MTIADLRKLAVSRQVRVRFRLPHELECVVDEHGIARVPGLRGVPDFNLESELSSAVDFSLEPVPTTAGTATRRIGRQDLVAMLSPASAAAAEEE